MRSVPLSELYAAVPLFSEQLSGAAPGAGLFEGILITSYSSRSLDPAPGSEATLGLSSAEETVIGFAGIEGLGLVVGGREVTTVEASIHVAPGDIWVRVDGAIRIRFPRDWLQPVRLQDGAWVPDPGREYSEVTIGAAIQVDQDWNFSFDGPNELTLPPAMIAETGFVIEGTVALDLSVDQSIPESIDQGLGPEWRGVVFKDLSIHLPSDLDVPLLPDALTLDEFHIGSGGLSGNVRGNWTPAVSGSEISGPGSGTLFGINFGLRTLDLGLQQNAVTQMSITGVLGVPFFEHALEVELGIDLAGNVSLEIGNAAGIEEFTLAAGGVDIMEVKLERLSVEKEGDTVAVGIGGSIKPLFGGLEWPTIEIDKMSIDSEGNVRIEGGWMDLPSQTSLNFHGFQLEITKLGFGKSDDGGNWIGFSGSIKLVDGLSAGGSVEGLRITWYDDGVRSPRITFNGVGVEFEVPDSIRFKGSVSYNELPGGVKRFDGDIKLELLALDLTVDGKLVIGAVDDPVTGDNYPFFAVYLGVELPAGIPLWSTGLALYGLAGLVAIQMEPNKGAPPNALHPASRVDEEWFENPDGSPGWYKRNPIGVTDLRSKWDPAADAFALGGGVTIGTLADNGFTFSGKVLLVISLPGPVILIEGKANLLKERSKLSDDPLFRALAVLDFRGSTFLVGLDAQYKYGGGGELIDIRGSAEAYFDFNDAMAWHLYLGKKDPRSSRIRAEIISIFEANSYFMLDARMLQTGAWVGWDKRWTFGPLKVVLEAWLEGNAVLSWKPVYFHGDVWLHGAGEVSVFGFGFGLGVDARLAADVFDPFHILGEFGVKVNLSWPLPDFDVTVTLEWGPEPGIPPLPLPTKEIAIEHFKSTASWVLPRGNLLLPNHGDDGFLNEPVAAAPESAAAPGNTPVVPLDARPHITFGRAVNDFSGVGVNPQPPVPQWERIGDPAKNQGPVRVRYGLREVALHKRQDSNWILVARKGMTPNDPGVPELYGSWAPVPALPAGEAVPGSDPPVGQVKLWLWSKTPFDYTRHSGRSWDEWFTDRFPDYPCIPPLPDRTVCCNFERYQHGDTVQLPYTCPEAPEITLIGAEELTVCELARPVDGKAKALCGLPSYIFGSGQILFLPISLVGQKAKTITLTVGACEPRTERHCVGFRQRKPHSKLPNPFKAKDVAFQVFDRDGSTLPAAIIGTPAPFPPGLEIGFRLEVQLPCPSLTADLTLTALASGITVRALDGQGRTVDEHQREAPQLETVLVKGPGIARLEIFASQDEAFLHDLCFDCEPVFENVTAIGVDADGNNHGPFAIQDHTIEVVAENLTGAILYARDEDVCLVEVCALLEPDAEEVARREDMAQHLIDSMALWSQEGEVLEPDTTYRLTVVTGIEATSTAGLVGFPKDFPVTELAYFRTQGPPGLVDLATPINHPPEETFVSGLEDLRRYVDQTIPASVPAPGEKPILPRPVYRAYDVGVEFNEDYVDLMYTIARRDLRLYLYDSNNQLVRDPQGRLIVLANRWGRVAELTLTESVQRWVSTLEGSDCADLDTQLIPHNRTLFSSDPGQVLDPDSVYEARLIPLLFHDDFSESLDDWEVVDQGTTEAPSNWHLIGHETLEGDAATVAGTTVTLDGAPDLSAVDPLADVLILDGDAARPSKQYRVAAVDDAAKTVTVDGEPALAAASSSWSIPSWGAVRQSSNLWGGSVVGSDPAKPGTLLLRGSASWRDYRISALLRSSDNDAIGLVFRYFDGGTFYRFSMDRERKYRRLVRLSDNVVTTLAEDDFTYAQDRDYLLTIEAMDDRLRVYQDGAPVFDVTDSGIREGRIGLYSWANLGATFSDITVDDLSEQASAVYRFKFTTSDFSTFIHQLHSFQDETWIDVPQDPALAALVASSVSADSAVSDDEARSFEALAAKVLGSRATQSPEEVQVSRIEIGGQAVGLLLRGPEPIDWSRTELEVRRSLLGSPLPVPPGSIKLIDATRAQTDPNEETVSVLLREHANVSGLCIETRALPGPIIEEQDTVLLRGSFESGECGLLFEEDFGPNALDRYTIVDDGTNQAPSSWHVDSGQIVQTSNIHGGSVMAVIAEKPGTMAITGRNWANIRLHATVRSEDNDAIGLVWRYRDADNYYRFSMDLERSYRRLIKRVGGQVSVLWEDSGSYVQGDSHKLRIDAYNDQILGFLDDVLLFSVRDGDLASGQVGLYCWANIGAHFEALAVEALEVPAVLWQPAFEDLTEVEIVDEGDLATPSAWAVVGGELRQTSNIWGGSTASAAPAKPGTYALVGDPAWRDYRISVRMSSHDDDAFGVMFRYQDANNYYRFSMDRARAYRRLIKKQDGNVTVLWEDAVPYQLGLSYEITLDAQGEVLVGYLDGIRLFEVRDSNLARGRIALYCWANVGAHFEQVVVTNLERRVCGWTIVDEGDNQRPSVWRRSSSALVQSSNIFAAALPEARGTYAIKGDPAWSDYRINLTLRADDNDAIGVIFRYQDAQNYYRLSLDNQRSYRRLVKVENGVFSTLWEDGGRFIVGESFTLDVVAVGSRLSGYQGGARLFDVNDAAHPAGRVGLYCWGNTGARFESIEVRTPFTGDYALFQDRFAAADLGAWTIVDEGTVQSPSDWATSGRFLRQTRNIHSLPLDPAVIDKKGTHIVAGDPTWDDFVFSAKLRSLDDDAIGVLFRYADAQNYYRFSMDSHRGYRRLVKSVAGVFTELWSDDAPYEVGRSYRMTIVAEGPSLRGYIDDVPAFVVDDGDLAAGQIGLYCWANQDAWFSEVRVFPIERALTEWSLKDDFAVLMRRRWRFVVEGDQQRPADWFVQGGELRQTGNIWGGSLNGQVADKPGTYALGQDVDWGDFRITVRLVSDDDDAIGVMFRYLDSDNYYRFSMDSQRSYRRLVKKVGGVLSVLWEDAVAYTVGREYLLSIENVGHTIAIFLDGAELLTLEDQDHNTGKFALYCWGNVGARFREVCVLEPEWTRYYCFGREQTQPAGTRFRVYSGNRIDLADEPANVQARFLASLDDRGRARFSPGKPLDLRLRKTDVNERFGAHERRFLSDNAYTAVPGAKVLRKADGTDFFVFVPDGSPAGSQLEFGQYRLRLCYRRDNQAADPNSRVLTQSGDSSPEKTYLDVPWP